MVGFLKLATILIRISQIKYISHKNDRYTINLMDKGQEGVFVIAVGFMDACKDKITICKKKDADDYTILKKWVDEQNNC